MTTQRWTLVDTEAATQWEFPRNPNKMTSPHGPRNSVIFSRAYGTDAGNGGISRVIAFRQQPYEWTFSGDIRTQQHYEDFVAWTANPNRLNLTDHLGRTWQIRIDSVDVTEQRQTARSAWRYEYTVKAIIYGRVA